MTGSATVGHLLSGARRHSASLFAYKSSCFVPSSILSGSAALCSRRMSQTTTAPFGIRRVDHIVLQCASIEKTLEWYTKYMGMKHSEFKTPNETRYALHFGQQKLNLHSAASPYQPCARVPAAGSADLCFILEADEGTTIEDVKAYWEKEGLEIVEGGVVDRTGALGAIRSVYTRDPDGNLIEVSKYAAEEA